MAKTIVNPVKLLKPKRRSAQSSLTQMFVVVALFYILLEPFHGCPINRNHGYV